jgi:1,4-dihydroxy-2-naphthoate octaprenyltransferase
VNECADVGTDAITERTAVLRRKRCTREDGVARRDRAPGRSDRTRVPPVIYVFANLLATQLPDRWADPRTGKRTLPTCYSPARLRWAYWLATGTTFGMFGLFPLVDLLPRPVDWGCLLLAPAGLVASRRFTRVTSPFPGVVTMVGLTVVPLLAWTLLVLARGGQRFHPAGVLGA